MGRLHLLGISTLIFYTWVVAAALSTSKKDLERAAELAVERAAEKAAERAVEKSLNSGNSSTITVTVKESYSNAKRTAEEAAAPGSESTRPYDRNLYNHQYAYNPSGSGGYKVISSNEDDEYSSVKDHELEQSFEPEKSSELSTESRERGSSPIATPIKNPNKSKLELDVTSADFGNFEISSDASFQGNFGLKSVINDKTKTYTKTYLASKADDPETRADIEDYEDATIFKIYNSRIGKNGWSRTKQKDWVRYRPLWDNYKSGINQDFVYGFRDMIASETTPKKNKILKKKEQNDQSDQFVQPLTRININPNNSVPLYQSLHRSDKLPQQQTRNYRNQIDKNKLPIKLYITIPIAYLRTQKDQNTNILEPAKEFKKQPNDKGPISSKQLLKKS